MKKSPGFEKIFNINLIEKNINNNLKKGGEIVTQTANQIAPIDKGNLRQNLDFEKSKNKFSAMWGQSYAVLRYKSNKKNPGSTFWIQKGYRKKKNIFIKIMGQNLFK